MKQFVLYHNPRCSKSRQMKDFLEQQSIDFEVREYLKQTLSRDELEDLWRSLGCPLRDLCRSTEADYKALRLKDDGLSDDHLLDAMVSHPKLIQRPIVSDGTKAIIGRPLENIEALL